MLQSMTPPQPLRVLEEMCGRDWNTNISAFYHQIKLLSDLPFLLQQLVLYHIVLLIVGSNLMLPHPLGSRLLQAGKELLDSRLINLLSL